MTKNDLIVGYNRDRVARDIEELSVEIKALSRIIKTNNNHISNEEFLAVEGDIDVFIINTLTAITDVINKIKSERGV